VGHPTGLMAANLRQRNADDGEISPVAKNGRGRAADGVELPV
jgi:hypothetical protein